MYKLSNRNKQIKNLLRDFPTPYDPKYWSDDGNKFSVANFNKDLYFKVHEFYAQLEKIKNDFPECQGCTFYIADMNGDGHCTLDEKVDPVGCPKDEWFEKWIGTTGTGNGIFKAI